MTWITAHAAQLLALAGALYTLLSIVNGMITAPKAKTVLGDIMDVLSFVSRAGAVGSIKRPLTRSCAPDTLAVPPGSSLRAFLPLLFLAAVAMQGCGVLKPLPEPTPAQYDAALKTCLADAGVSQGLAVGESLLTCFEQPNETVAQYEQCAEQDSGTLALDVFSIVAQCAVDSWLDFNPVPANTSPKPAVLAAREVRIHFLHVVAGR